MKINKILLIRSSHYADNGELVKANGLFDRLTITNLAELGLPLLAAYTPDHIKVEMADDCLGVTPLETDAEVVGISAMVHYLDRARDLADEFKRRGKVVLMGGFLPTQHPELVRDHVDALCIGEADTIWPQMLKDIENDCLKPEYRAALIMFGMPDDEPDIFDRSVSFLERYGAASAEFFILTPYPATPLGERLLEEGKIIDTDPSHLREPYCVFEHPKMSPEEIQQGYWRAFRRFFSIRSIFKRMLKANRRTMPYLVLNNFTYWLKIRRKIVPTQFQRGNY